MPLAEHRHVPYTAEMKPETDGTRKPYVLRDQIQLHKRARVATRPQARVLPAVAQSSRLDAPRNSPNRDWKPRGACIYSVTARTLRLLPYHHLCLSPLICAAMLEARFPEASLFKKILDSVSGLIQDTNLNCTDEGIRIQAIDTAHVALCAVEIRPEAFTHYRCDRPMILGVRIDRLQKVVRTANNKDTLTLRKADNSDTLTLIFQSTGPDRVASYDLALDNIDSEQMDIPPTDYKAVVTLASAEYARITRDLIIMGEDITVGVDKNSVRFEASSEQGSGTLVLKQGTSSAPESDDEGPSKKRPRKQAKREPLDDEDESAKPTLEGEEEEQEEEEEERPVASKRKRSRPEPSDDDVVDVPVQIHVDHAVKLKFALKFMAAFSKAGPLSPAVTLRLSPDYPLLVEYAWEHGHVHFYLAPKLSEDDDE